MKPWYRRRAIWRLVVGPFLTVATAGALLLLARSGIQVPGPGAFMLGAIFVSSYIGGAAAGYLSALVGIGCASVLLSEPGLLFIPAPEFRLLALGGCGLALPLLGRMSTSRPFISVRSEIFQREKIGLTTFAPTMISRMPK